MNHKPGLDPDHLILDQLHAVAGHLGPSRGEKLGRRHPVAGREPLHVSGGGVAWCAGIDHRHPPAGPSEHERGAQAGGSAADHHHVIRLSLHGDSFNLRVRPVAPYDPPSRYGKQSCRSWDANTRVTGMATSPEIDAVLAEVGPRLKRARTQRGVTLTELAAATGHLQEHAVAAGIRATPAQPRAAAADRPGPPDTARRPGRRTGGRRPANPAQADSPQGPRRRPADPPAERHACLEGADPAGGGRTRAAHPRRLRVAVRAVRARCV